MLPFRFLSQNSTLFPGGHGGREQLYSIGSMTFSREDEGPVEQTER